MSVKGKIDELANLLADRFFEIVEERLSAREVEVPIPPSDGVPARRPVAPRSPPKQLPPSQKSQSQKSQRAAEGIVALLQREDPENAGVKSARLSELLVQQGLTENQAKHRIAAAKNARLIRLEGRTHGTRYFRV